MSMMFTAKVKDGQLVVDPVVELPEGATVTVLVNDDAEDDDLELSADEESELDEAIAEADRKGWIPAEQVIAELRRR
ncbi:MAG TPA: hypothetical protein VHT91_15000 [Kofleriaceae bacterium]|nr:hypothetical protein [Kofleriaceae bacterium]